MAEEDAEAVEEASQKTQEALEESDRVRQAVADAYTFVRSREINQVISSFSFDHYIDEAKRKIKSTGRDIRDASGQVFDIRPSQLEALTKVEESFNKSLESARKLAEKAGSK